MTRLLLISSLPDTANRRLVTIVMDDAYTLLESDIMKRAKMIARNAIDQLGPSDLAAGPFFALVQSACRLGTAKGLRPSLLGDRRRGVKVQE